MKRICFVLILAIVIYSGYAMPSTRVLYLHFDDATYINTSGGDTGADGATRSYNSPYVPNYNPDPVRTDLPSPQGGKNIRARISTYVEPDHSQGDVWASDRGWNLDEFYIKFYMYIEPDIDTDELESIKMFRIESGARNSGEGMYIIVMWGPRGSYQWSIYYTQANGTWSPKWAHPGYQQGKWVKYEFYTKYNTPGANDGILRIWVDGELSWERTDLTFRSSLDYVVNSLGAAYHFKTFGSPIGDIEGHVRIDDLEVWDGMPPEGPDTTPPVRSNGQPTGTLPAGTNQTTLSLTTNENAICKYSTTAGVSFDSMTNTFSTTGGTSHSTVVTGLTDGSTYNYYIRAQDTAGNVNTDDYLISFSVGLPDTTPPAAVSNLGVPSSASNSCNLSWTAPGDDGNAGTATTYDIRYSTSAITESNWSSAAQATGEPTPQTAGTSQSMTVSGLSPSTTYYFAIKTSDEAPNWSALSNVVSATTQPTSDNLASGITPSVDSTYSGFTVTPITDGVIDAYGGTTTTWASAESSVDPHWIVIDFGETKTVSNVIIYWAWNDYQSNWMTSRQYHIQYWNGSDYVTTATVTDPPSGGMTATYFSAVDTSRIRIYQPADMGPEYYSRVMWLTELEIYSVYRPPAPGKPVHFDN